MRGTGLGAHWRDSGALPCEMGHGMGDTVAGGLLRGLSVTSQHSRRLWCWPRPRGHYGRVWGWSGAFHLPRALL